MIDEHQPFCGLSLALGREDNLSRPSPANITAPVSAQQDSNVIQVIQAVAVVTPKFAASCLELRPAWVAIVTAGSTLEVCDILLLVEVEGIFECVSGMMNLSFFFSFCLSFFLSCFFLPSFLYFLSFLFFSFLLLNNFPPALPLPFLSLFLSLSLPVPLPLSLERVSTDSQLVPPPLPSPPPLPPTSSSPHPSAH